MTPLVDRLMADPEVAANLHRLVEETGIPMAVWHAWLAAPCPPGLDEEDWEAAAWDRARRHGPWPESALRALTRMAASTRRPAA